VTIAGVRRSRRAGAAWLVIALLVSGCISRPRFMRPAAEREWSGAYASAQNAVVRGDYALADRILADFAREFPNSSEGIESGYWRAVFKLDPANSTASTREAVSGLDAYLARSRNGLHRGEATTLRRLAQQLLALDRALVARESPAPEASRDEEVRKLREELQATKDELERIKRRLAAPKP
jgi:hypothetical protein